MSDSIRIILSTHDNLMQAQDLAKTLVEERVAACVNVIPGAHSVFRWEGEVQVENELLLVIKTTPEKSPAVQAMLEEHHTYDVPEIVELQGQVMHKPYMDWVRDCLD